MNATAPPLGAPRGLRAPAGTIFKNLFLKLKNLLNQNKNVLDFFLGLVGM
jgi:hypothetical protein